jgi:hypothetical protein
VVKFSVWVQSRSSVNGFFPFYGRLFKATTPSGPHGKASLMLSCTLCYKISGLHIALFSGDEVDPSVLVPRLGIKETVKADSHIACRAHEVPLPCRAAKGLECVFPIWFTQCGRVWFTLAMPRLCHALTMPFFSKPRHSTAVERRPVGYLPAFGFFRLPRGVPRRLSEAYRSSSQRSIPAIVKSASSTLQEGQSVKLLD